MDFVRNNHNVCASNGGVLHIHLHPCSLAMTSTGRVGFWFCGFLCPGTPESAAGSGSGFKAFQKTGPRLKVLKSHPTDWEKPGIEPATPGL